MVYFMVFGFLLLCIFGVPIAFGLGISSALPLIIEQKISLIIMPQRFFAGIDSFPMLALPFFLLSAALMSGGGLVKRIISMFNSFFGHIKGSLAYTNVATSMFFAGISGSGIADTSSEG
ncbi:MAG TPA: TRAP transporter large permease subunit, partial [Bacillota bacterium]|nr:TRAP transporter large permease subunit [Bacillota bacterium]